MPPDAARIEAAKTAGNVSIEMLEPGKRARLNFKNYVKNGDIMGVEVDLANNRPLALKVATYLDSASDAVTLDVKMSHLLDGITYPSDTTLHAIAKNLKVTVQNSGSEPLHERTMEHESGYGGKGGEPRISSDERESTRKDGSLRSESNKR